MKYRISNKVLVPATVIAIPGNDKDEGGYVVMIDGVSIKTKELTDTATERLEGYTIALKAMIDHINGKTEKLPTIRELLTKEPTKGTE